jgi:hypothetical protein
MFEMYKKEHNHFKKELYSEEYKDMWDYLDNIFNYENKINEAWESLRNSGLDKPFQL